jgi:parallel beta-helix repeat protein
MKNIITLAFIFFLHSAFANNYYFSAVDGDDSRTPAQAQNPSTPWKTLNKLNLCFNRLKPGDAVLLKRGEIFYGSINIHKSGTAGSPIVIGAYGTGNKPVITSLVTLNNWVSKGNGIWESYNPTLGSTVSTVLLNGVEQQLGRYPNSDAPNKGYLTFESHIGKTSITDNEFSSKVNWTGAEVVIRTRRWVLDRNLITSHSGNTIHYKASSIYTPSDNYGYFIQNDIRTLDKSGEWFYDGSNKKLSVYFGSNAPSSYAVQATSHENLITSKKYSNVVFDNLSIKGANASGVYIRFGSNIRISNCDILFSGENGIMAYYHNKITIENCTISNSNNDGIDLGYSGDYATIRNNKIINTSVFAGMGGSGDGRGIALHSNGNNTIIEYNEVINTGYFAINFNGNSTIVKNNYVDGFCTTKDDGGGIYTYTGPGNVTKHGRKITGNIVINGKGAGEGTDFPASYAAEGIYLDDNSSGVEITNNTIANLNGRGLFLNNARNLVIRNNTFYNNEKQLYASQYRKIKGAAIRNLTVKGNIFFSKDDTQKAAHFTTDQNDNNLIGILDSNFYSRPVDDRLVIINSYVNNSGARVKENLDLEGWQKKYNKDWSSKTSVKPIASYKLNRITGSNKFANGTFSTSMRGVQPSSCRLSLQNSGQLNDGYLEVTPSASYSCVFVNVGDLKAGAKYILRYTAKGAGSNPIYLGASLRKAGTPYTTLTPVQYRKVNLSASDNEIMFSSSTNETSAQIVFCPDAANKYYVDNIQLYEADATTTNIDDSLRFVYNPGREIRRISLEGSYVDIKNNKYSNSITLQPFQSAILIKARTLENTAPNSSPTVSITNPQVNAEYKAFATIKIDAEASDKDGSVRKVEFYNGITLLHTATEAPYTYSWKNVPAGNYILTAKATDDDGSIATSESVSMSVTAPPAAKNKAPEVKLTSPAINTNYTGSANISMSADASDADGAIKKVEFYNGTTLLHTEYELPYNYTWNNVAAGNYTITAKATDNDGSVTTSTAVSLRVAASSSGEDKNIAPKVNITSPAVNQSFNASVTINISAHASDDDGRVRRVEYYIGQTLLHTERGRPYSWNWRNVRAGTYTITAVAIDDKGAETRSSSVTISVGQRNVSHRDARNSDTSVAAGADVISNDTTKTIDNLHAVALQRNEVKMAVPKTYTVKLFPNPAISKIQIGVEGFQMVSQKANLSIQNLSGIVVKSVPVVLSGKTLEADVTSLSPGMYILSIVNDNLVISKKFIKN